MTETALPPIERSISVSWDPQTAFNRFTREFPTWWPAKTHSIGGPRLKRVVFEPHVGGCIFEEHVDGRRFGWGKVVAFDPPGRVAFTWHPSRDESTSQDVVIEFLSQPGGTLVKLTSSNWQRWGEGAKRARKGYSIGWKYVLMHWAGRSSPGMVVMNGLMKVMDVVQAFRGGRAAVIAKSGGEMPRA